MEDDHEDEANLLAVARAEHPRRRRRPAAVTVDLFFCPWDYRADDLDGHFTPLSSGPGGQMSNTCHVASINGQVPIGVMDSSWSEIKTMFR